MKTSHRIAATLVTAIALASCTGGTDTNDDDLDQPDVTTDTTVEDDESDTSVEDDESED